MAKPKFYLKSVSNEQSTSERLIFLSFSYNGHRFKFSTGLKVNPDDWNEQSQKIREKASYGLAKARTANDLLRKMANAVEVIHLESLSKGIILSTLELRQEMENQFRKESSSTGRTLSDFIEVFIQLRSESPSYQVQSIKVYRTVKGKVASFIKMKGKKSLEFKDVSLEFWEQFRDFLFGQNLSENTIHKNLTTLKTIINSAREKDEWREVAEGAYVFSSVKKLGIAKEPVAKVYLTVEELELLNDLELANERLVRVRDLFLLGANTGLRFSDFTRIHPDNFQELDGVRVLAIDTLKTGEKVIIPINDMVEEVLNRNEGEAPKGISNQKMNQYLKELGQLAGFDAPLLITKKIGGVKVTTRYQKYELLSTHTARRSFATNAFKAGLPPIAIMKLTGHRTESAFMRYIQISKEENAVLLSSNDFFKRGKLRLVK
ncbi:MAG: site-specific integrase [Saprospiraceae bacterium]|nr:site-specific integrase [Saprospiraceae bacterium]